eukprot:6205441-Pleurochrysis_carterae.AAC.4
MCMHAVWNRIRASSDAHTRRRLRCARRGDNRMGGAPSRGRHIPRSAEIPCKRRMTSSTRPRQRGAVQRCAYGPASSRSR